MDQGGKEGPIFWMLGCTCFVLLVQAGFCCLETGLVRTKNNLDVAMKSASAVCAASAAYWIVGFALMYGPSAGGWFGTRGFTTGAAVDPYHLSFVVFNTACCAMAATIVSGAGAQRIRFAGYLLTTSIVAGLSSRARACSR